MTAKTLLSLQNHNFIILAIVFCICASPAYSAINVDITGGGISQTQEIQGTSGNFTFQMPLKRNAVNVFSVEARDDNGNIATSQPIEVTQVSLDKVVVAKASSKRLTSQEVRDLARQGVINVDDPENFYVSKFDVVFTVNQRPVHVVKYVTSRKQENGSSGEEDIEVPKDKGSGQRNEQPQAKLIYFEFPDTPTGITPPPIPALLLIDGTIKTLKEFFKVKLILLNTSDIFELHDMQALIKIPAGVTGISPESGLNQFGNIDPHNQVQRKWIVRGDRIGHYNLKLEFSGSLTGPGITTPVPIKGSTSTQIEVKGPPHLAVVVEQPPHVEQGEPYQLLVNITNTSDIPANFASLILNLGEKLHFDSQNGPATSSRDLGDILPGQTVSQTFTVVPSVSGDITSCVGGASSNLQLFVNIGSGSCATGTYKAETRSPSDRVTVRVVPVNGAMDVGVDVQPTVFFSKAVNTVTLTTGSPGTTLLLTTRDGTIVPTSLHIERLPSGEMAVSLQHSNPLDYDTDYIMKVSPDIYDTQGVQIASGMTVMFHTAQSPLAQDMTPPQISLVIPGNIDVNNIVPGSRFNITVIAQDNQGIERVEYLMDGKIRAIQDSTPFIFTIDTEALEPDSSHELKFRAFDLSGNGAETVQGIVMGQSDTVPPQITTNLSTSSALQGESIRALAEASDNGNIKKVDFFLDQANQILCSSALPPYSCNIDTSQLSAGIHQITARAIDAAGNAAEEDASFEIIADTSPPIINVLQPEGTVQVLAGSGFPVRVQAHDNMSVKSIRYFVDSASSPFATSSITFVDTSTIPPGDHVLRIVATDPAGNTAEKSVSFSVIAPPEPGPNPPAPVDLSKIEVEHTGPSFVRITGAPGAAPYLHRIEVSFADGGKLDCSSDISGGFSIDIDAQPGSEITFTVIDAEGKRSEPRTLTLPTIERLLVSPQDVSLHFKGETIALTYSLLFSDNKSVRLDLSQVSATVDDQNIARLTQSGKIIAISSGQTSLHVAFQGVDPVSVPISVDIRTISDISLNPDTLSFQYAGETRQIKVTALYSDGTSSALHSGVIYRSNNPNIVSVSNSGIVTAIANGSTTIEVTYNNLSKQLPVTVAIRHPVSLNVSPQNINFSSFSDTAQLQVIVNYDNGTNEDVTRRCSYASSDSQVASVTSYGLVIPTRHTGNAIITVSYDGLTAVSVSVNFQLARVTGLLVAPPRIDFEELNASRQLSVMYQMSDGTSRAADLSELEFLSSNQSVATVDDGGIVSSVGTGTAQITIRYLPDGTVPEVTIPVTVADVSTLPTEPPEIIELQRTALGVGDHLVIFAKNISESVALDHVFLGDKELPVEMVARGMIVARIIPGVQSGNVTLRVYDKDSTNDAQVTILPRKAVTKTITDKFLVAGIDGTWDLAEFDLQYINGDRAVISGNWDITTTPSWTGHLFLSVDDGQPVELSPSQGPLDISPYLSEGVHHLKFSIAASSNQTLPGNSLAEVYVLATTMPFDGAGQGDGTVPVQAITLTAGQSIIITAEGTANDGTSTSTPDGYTGCNDSCAMGLAKRLALIGRFENNQPFVIGQGPVVFTAPQDGTLYLGINDSSYGDNTGGYTVTIYEAKSGAGVATDGLYLQAGPPDTGVFAGLRELLADGADHRIQVTVTGLNFPDGTKVGVTAGNVETSYNGHWVRSAGGSIIGGEQAANNRYFRIFTVENGMVTVTYSDSGLVLNPGQTKIARVQIVPANDQNRITSTRAVAVAEVKLAGLSSGSFILSQASVIADGSGNTVHFTLTDIRDALGNLVPDGTKVGVTAGNVETSYNGHSVRSAGGSIIGGEQAANNRYFRIFTVENGKIEGEYNTGSISLNGQETRIARLQAVAARPNNSISTTRAFAVKEIVLVSPYVGANNVTIDPSYIFVDGGNHTATITITNLKDAGGNPLPDGQKIGIITSYGEITDGQPCNNKEKCRVFTVTNRTVTANYSVHINLTDIIGIFTSPADTLSLAYADSNNNIIGTQTSKIGEIPFSYASKAEIEAANSTTAGQTISFKVKNIRDSLGNLVPNGAKIAVSAGGMCGRMAYPPGGTISGGQPYESDDGNYTIFTVQNGEVTGAFTAPSEGDYAAILVKPANYDETVPSDPLLPCIAVKGIDINQ